MRRRYLIAYDVSDDKRRTGVFKTLESNGDHVQYSVFVCDLNARELAELKGRLAGLINLRQDQVLILDMGSADAETREVLQCIGKAYEIQARVMVI
jgi:CRISPR-associated protein Cas2